MINDRFPAKVDKMQRRPKNLLFFAPNATSVKKEDQPKIEVDYRSIDYMLDGLTIVSLLISFGLAAYYYGKLPDEIPSHMNIKGEVDAIGSKMTLWILPIIGFVLAAGFAAIYRIPHKFNYIQTITEKNAKRIYESSLTIMRYINAVIQIAFAYITYTIIFSAFGKSSGLGPWFIIILLVATFGGTIAMFMVKGKE